MLYYLALNIKLFFSVLRQFTAVGVLLILLYACQGDQSQHLFEYVDSSRTRIDFSNDIVINDEINVIDFQYCYNGGGVGIGDFNNDQLPDLIFTGNQVSSKLYLNQGNLKFLDITEMATVQTQDWVTGVSIVDINADGFDDIYLNVGGADCQQDCKNLLFVNQGLNDDGIPTFLEKAKAYGLADNGYSQQTVFFDYDLDGDLDAYILRNGNVRFDKNAPIPKRFYPDHLNDVLLRNDTSDTIPHPQFTNVSTELKGSQKGFGLGLGINDFNDDGLVDVYVANDFITNDLLYLNTVMSDSTDNGFIESSKDFLAHQTYNAMGVDVADVNNDSHPDILVLDMLPDGYQRLKTMVGAMNYDKYELALKNGYSPQYMRNTLQVHSGGVDRAHFSEVSLMSKLARTDWSWAPLMVDFDLDGDKDIFVTNGYGTDITDLDFINYSQQQNAFGDEESRDKKIKELVARQKPVKLQNTFFENQGNLEFDNTSVAWAAEKLSLSNGAAYADLDLDGDLDIVVNNLNEKAFVLENKASERENFNFLKIRLIGPSKNKNAIGAKVTLWNDGESQTHFQSVIRGYLSSMDPTIVFGLKNKQIDSVDVKWPSGKHTIKTNITSNQTLILDSRNGKTVKDESKRGKAYFIENTKTLRYEHFENKTNDYSNQHLLLTQYSKTGPCMAVANIDKEEGEELFIGGSNGNPGTIWSQYEGEEYMLSQKLDSLYEDTAAVFFDYDNDGDLDLYVASGGNEFEANSEEYLDRLYENKKGTFERVERRLPNSKEATSVVAPYDFDKDGDMDLFVGSNIVPKNYPETPNSYLLKNDNGIFSKVEVYGLQNIGMVTDASWSDIDGDGWHELVVIGEWMPITLFENHEGHLKKGMFPVQNKEGNELSTAGWWRAIQEGDFDNDGDIDFIVANKGLNNFINPTEEYPVYIYTKDYDGNGSIDPLVGAYYDTDMGKRLMPLHTRDDVMKQLVVLKDKYQSYANFAQIDFNTLLSIENKKAVSLNVTISASVLLENKGDGSFQLKELPKMVQLSPINKILVKDFDNDGNLDALLAGNDFYAESHFGRYDALTGLFLKGNGDNGFDVFQSPESGFYLPYQTNDLVKLTNNKNEVLIVAGQNNEQAKVFKWNKTIDQ
ncbi:VCBS repeat-containing protein [uncultured Croceitalea sp.]|uniref:VCBS repeat-containing protein n=1 Tax=uncultured Croceitalea sp. TaxID=1798908 RepID=UPI0033063B62